MPEFLPPPRTLLAGLAMVESARWREGRLWFAHWGVGEVIAVDMDGKAEVMADGPPQMGWAIDWLPDGQLITTGPSVTRHEPDGALMTSTSFRRARWCDTGAISRMKTTGTSPIIGPASAAHTNADAVRG